MAIADTLAELATDISNAYDSIDDKGGTLPQDKNTNNLATAIDSIQTEITPRVETVNVTSNRSYSSTNEFLNVYSSYVNAMQNDEVLAIIFKNNTNNSRAGRYVYVLIERLACVNRVGYAYFYNADYGLDVYEGCTIEFRYLKYL